MLGLVNQRRRSLLIDFRKNGPKPGIRHLGCGLDEVDQVLVEIWLFRPHHGRVMIGHASKRRVGRDEQSAGLGVGEDRYRGQGSRPRAGFQKELIHPTHERETFVPRGGSGISTIGTIPRTISLHPVRTGWRLRLAGDNDDDPRFQTAAWNLNQFPELLRSQLIGGHDLPFARVAAKAQDPEIVRCQRDHLTRLPKAGPAVLSAAPAQASSNSKRTTP
eukprot:1200350-Pleurochrysis_carterae.AAC.1